MSKLTNYNIHLIKDSFSSLDQIVVNKNASGKKIITKKIESSVIDAILVYEEQSENNISWVGLLQTVFEDVPQFQSKHASAVVFYKVEGRYFAVSFGYGRKLIKDGSFVSDFGLKTALCICDENTLKAVNFRTIEERTRIGRLQLSDQADVTSFHLETDTDLLRGVEAKSKKKDICESVGAKWENLIISTKQDLIDLPQTCQKLLEIYSLDSLPEEFRWVENVKRINDKLIVSKLNDELKKLLNTNQFDNIRLAVPDMAGPALGTTARLFKPNGKELSSSVKEYLDNRPKDVKDTVKAMKELHKILIVDDTTEKAVEKFSVYKCTVAEINVNNNLYLLADGEWFSLNAEFVTEVNEYIKTIPSVNHSMPKWKNKEREEHWNDRAASSWNKTVNMDKAMVYHGGGQNKFEVADLINRDSTPTLLCHVKRIDKNSGGLSHLFAQGSVSAELLSQDKQFREKVIAKIPRINYDLKKDLRKDNFDPRKWNITYVILGVDDDRDEIVKKMPFFSRVNLRKHVLRLKSMQFKISLVGIPTE